MITSNDIRISFHHHKETGTDCFLKITSEGITEEFIGSTVRYYTDKHDRDLARKYSLQKAIITAIQIKGSLSKEVRTLIWNKYRDQKPEGRW